jgi:hypothetical protein
MRLYSVSHVRWPLGGATALDASGSDPGALSSFCPAVPGVGEGPLGVGRGDRGQRGPDRGDQGLVGPRRRAPEQGFDLRERLLDRIESLP